MEQNHQRIGVVNWLTLLAAAALSLALARFAGLTTGLITSLFLGLGFLVAAVSYFQMRLEERERQESIEFEELKKAKGDSALFAGEDTFTAKRSREQFDRFLVPAFSVILLGLQATAIWLFWRWLPDAEPPGSSQAAISMALYALFALVLFLLGKYSAGIARLENQPLLRPSAGYLMLGSATCFVSAAVEAAVWFNAPRVDRYTAYVFLGLLALVSIETLVNLIMELYRPRVRGKAIRVLYESRLIGLLSQPTGLISTAAQALDYQFGFKVSETWFYRFLERALSWIILLQLAALFLSTTVIIVEPNETALLERFGRPVPGRETLGPGLHLKWPWPIDQAYRFPSREIHSFTVGVIPDEDLAEQRTILWTRPHYKEEFNLLVASEERPSARSEEEAATEKAVPANLLAASIPVHYEVTDLVAWTYDHSNPDALLEALANREVTRYLVSVDFDTVMSLGREVAGRTLQERIQAAADDYGLGARIVYIGLENIHPPIGDRQVQVAAAFEEVIGSMQQRETNILAALSYQAGRIPGAQAEATNLLTTAKSEHVLKVATAEAGSHRFEQQDAAFQAAPSVYQQRVYLESLAQTIAPVRKYLILSTNTSDVINLNLEEKIRSDLASGVILPPDAVPPSAQP
jgi:regulator of protease activity HflC (stomatin/prohibitin superfamily)